MVNPIVTVNVSQTQAPIPNTLQKQGAIISQGGTILAAGMYSLLKIFDDLTPLLAAPLALSTVAWSNAFGGQVTATAGAAHGVPVGQLFPTTIAGVTPAGYNGTFMAMATSRTQFTYYLSANPGSQTVAGTYTPKNVAELQSMAKTFFSQEPGTQGVYVLELDAGNAAAGVTALQDFINSSPQFFYSYLVPRSWADESTFLAYVATFESTTAKTYFFVTVNEQNYTPFVAQAAKSVIALIEAPSYSSWATQIVSAATWSGGLATVTTGANHGVAPGQTFKLTGISPAGYNGTFIALNGTTGTSLVYAVAPNPGAYVSGGSLVKSTYSNPPQPVTEYTHAADFFTTLNYDPSSTNKVTPLAFSYMFGVTNFPLLGNSALLTTLFADNINYVGDGSEGGITNSILRNGHMMDGRPFNYWYSVDWMQINIKLGLANAIINGSNDPLSPLYYNQDGIDRLQQAAASICGSAITFGLALGRVILATMDGNAFARALQDGGPNRSFPGNVVVNAVPFTAYLTANPSHYRLGIYNGLSITFTPLRGFESITVNINVTDFVA